MDFYTIFATLHTHTAETCVLLFYDCGNNNNWCNGMYAIVTVPNQFSKPSDKHIELLRKEKYTIENCLSFLCTFIDQRESKVTHDRETT